MVFKKQKNNEDLKNIGILILVVLLVIGFFYVARLFSGEGGITSDKPVVFCIPENSPPDKQECYYTAHDHFQLSVFLGGKEQNIKFEEGDLEEGHTHAQKNKIHWHSTLPVDPLTKQVNNWSEHSVSAALQELGFVYPDKRATLIVNGQVEEKGLNYIWEDGDVIEVRFG